MHSSPCSIVYGKRCQCSRIGQLCNIELLFMDEPFWIQLNVLRSKSDLMWPESSIWEYCFRVQAYPNPVGFLFLTAKSRVGTPSILRRGPPVRSSIACRGPISPHRIVVPCGMTALWSVEGGRGLTNSVKFITLKTLASWTRVRDPTGPRVSSCPSTDRI